MRKVKSTYAEFHFPGSFTSNVQHAVVSSTDPYKLPWPDNAYCLRMYERVDVIDEEGETFRGQAKQVGKTYYHCDSKVESLEEVERNPAATPILVSNMRNNGYTHIVWSRNGNWPQPFNPEKDEVLKPVKPV